MKAMRTAGNAYRVNDQTKEAMTQLAGIAGVAAPLVTGLGILLAFAEFHRELFSVVLDVGQGITEELKQSWSHTDLAVVTSGGFTRVYGWLWDISAQTVTGPGRGTFDQVESFATGLAWPRDLEGTIRQLWV